MKANKTYRTSVNKLYLGIICLFSFLALLPFLSILWELLKNGTKQLNIGFFTETPPLSIDVMWAHLGNEGMPGGIVNGILGTFYMLFIALLIAVPLGIFTGIYLHDNWNKKFTLIQRHAIAILDGMPSIIIGITVYLWIARPLHSFSALAGGISLAIIMYPSMVQHTKEALWKIPTNLKEYGFALGSNYSRITCKIILPNARNGIIAGILFSISKTIGITTPLIITALGTSVINWNVLDPTSSMSLLIWQFFNNPNMIDFMWTTALLLLILVILFNCIAKYIYWKWEKNIL